MKYPTQIAIFCACLLASSPTSPPLQLGLKYTC